MQKWGSFRGAGIGVEATVSKVEATRDADTGKRYKWSSRIGRINVLCVGRACSTSSGASRERSEQQDQHKKICFFHSDTTKDLNSPKKNCFTHRLPHHPAETFHAKSSFTFSSVKCNWDDVIHNRLGRLLPAGTV
jgi:hypothetical protein